MPGLIRALSDSADRVRKQAAWALGAIDDSRAVEPLLHALTDQSSGVRQQAAWALGAIGDCESAAGPASIAEGQRCRRTEAGRLGDRRDRSMRRCACGPTFDMPCARFKRRPG